MSFEPATEVAPDTFLIDAHYHRPRLAACYVVKGQSSAAVVETGHAAAVPRILAALEQVGVPRAGVSHVIVTHVHLDHAGGAGALMRALPNATLVAHPRGARHLIDPAKLWAGTAAVYGVEATRALYGEPIAVPANRVVEAPDGHCLDLGERRFTFFDAPGHARHHLVVLDESTRGVFTGDSFGLSYRELDSPRGPFFYPTTTPVQFDPLALHSTLDRILAQRPEHVFLTHFGMVSGNLAAHAATLHRTIDLFVRRAEAAPAGESRHGALKAALQEDLRVLLREHGSPLHADQLQGLFDGDLELNAAGLEAWLDSRKAAS
ncbi:MAG: MBL fold metallo-hydrolase [Deltaproteobacteria bacterium]|nr:MBL fold metallo-hydrolase [Deltaproteobacteria bacterium]